MASKKLAKLETIENIDGHLKMILGNAKECIFIKDRSLKYIYVNHAMEELFGRPASELFFKTDLDLFGKAAAEQMKKVDMRVLAGETVDEDVSKPVNGRMFTFHTIKMPVYDEQGRISGLCGMARDITERKISEERSRRNEALLRTMADRSPLAFYFVDKRTDRILYYNRRFIEIWSLGSLVDEIAEGIINNQHLITYCASIVRDSEGFIDSCRLFGGPEATSVVEDELKFNDGRIIRRFSVPVMGEKGVYFGRLYIYEDITEKKRIEESLERVCYELEDRIQERTADLRRVNASLKEHEARLNEAKSRAELYVDLMGHDINNMNQVGMGYLEMAMDVLGKDHNVDYMLLKSLDMLKNSSKLIDNVRKLQRVKAGELRQEPIDLSDVLSRVVSEYMFVPNRDIRINYKPAPGSLVMANDLLKDVFSNLIGNSIKHSSGPLIIDIFLSGVIIDDVSYYRVTVEDNGPGIPDVLKEKIFDRLQRGKTKIGGSGIGLYLVKSLVEDYGGSVRVEDRVEGDKSKGTRFIVLLPVH